MDDIINPTHDGYLSKVAGRLASSDWDLSNESVSNGMWLGVLKHYFPFPGYLIAPEFKFPHAKPAKPDLVVWKKDRLVLAFEGKGRGEPIDHDQCLKHLEAMGTRGPLLFASGEECSFLELKNNHGLNISHDRRDIVQNAKEIHEALIKIKAEWEFREAGVLN